MAAGTESGSVVRPSETSIGAGSDGVLGVPAGRGRTFEVLFAGGAGDDAGFAATVGLRAGVAARTGAGLRAGRDLRAAALRGAALRARRACTRFGFGAGFGAAFVALLRAVRLRGLAAADFAGAGPGFAVLRAFSPLRRAVFQALRAATARLRARLASRFASL